MGTDGIPIEKLVVRPEPNLDAVAAEYTTCSRASLSAASRHRPRRPQELSIVTEKMVALLVSITRRVLPVRRPRPRRSHGARPLRACTRPARLEREFA